MLFLESVYYYTLICAAAMALFRLCSSAGKASGCLCVYILYGLLNEWATLYSIQQHENNFLLANLYDYLSLIMLLTFYHQSLSDPGGRSMLRLIVLSCVVLLLFNLLFFPEFRSAHQLNLEYISTLIIIVTALYTIYRLAIADQYGQIHKQFLFWISAQFIGYKFIGLWCRSTVYPFNLENEAALQHFYYTLLIANIVHYALLGLLLLFFKHHQRSAI